MRVGVYMNKTVESRIDSLLEKMSLREKLGQLTQLETVSADIMDELKEKGLWFYAADMGGDAYESTDFCGAVGLVLGSEGEGISRLVKEKCDFTVSIPLYGRVNSMNVSCAAAVLLSEIARQRRR